VGAGQEGGGRYGALSWRISALAAPTPTVDQRKRYSMPRGIVPCFRTNSACRVPWERKMIERYLSAYRLRVFGDAQRGVVPPWMNP
jgi:hypothetical protein